MRIPSLSAIRSRLLERGFGREGASGDFSRHTNVGSRRCAIPRRGQRLHVGCGKERLEGWINIDYQDSPSVDLVADVTRGLDFEESQAVYAEHFLEHLTIEQALEFLSEAHRVLAENGLIRLGTPNLDWVWATHYSLNAHPQEHCLHGLRLNRAFYGWEHRFLWNRPLLELAVEASGFTDLNWPRWGESRYEMLRSIERHETWEDSEQLPHILIVEGKKGIPDRKALDMFRRTIRAEFLAHTSS